jgi:hypothetical protein
MDNKERCKIYRQKIKLEVFTHYCNGDIKCKDCNERDINKLEINHINGGGNKHRIKLFKQNSGGCKFYNWLKKNKFPDGYDCRCKKHNMEYEVKLYNGNEGEVFT